MDNIVYLSLGSNLGDRAANIAKAIELLRRCGNVLRVSRLYETEPVEVTDQPWFLNCVVEVRTSQGPQELLRLILEIEKQMGRRRIQPKGPREIDLDILVFGDAVVDSTELTIPHPAMHERRFVLAPLAEIAPDLRHPVLGKTSLQLLQALPPGGQAARAFPVKGESGPLPT